MRDTTSGYYHRDELLSMGFASLGENILLSRKARIYGADKISLGSCVRIDDFAILSGKIEIGSFVHIGASSNITGSDIGVCIKDFCGISSHVRIFAISDDYTGESMTNPWIPDQFKRLQKAPITLEKHCIIGSGSMLLAGAYLAEGVSIGAMSLVLRKTKAWGVYFGIPAKRIKERSRNILKLEKQFLDSLSSDGGGGVRYLPCLSLRKRFLESLSHFPFLPAFLSDALDIYPIKIRPTPLDIANREKISFSPQKSISRKHQCKVS